MLSAAAWAPSGSNVQPWRIYVVTGAPLVTAEQRSARSAWSQVRKTDDEIVSPPDELMLFCGMSIGHGDPTVNYIRTGRAALDETVTFVDD